MSFRPDYAVQYAAARLFLLLTQSLPLSAALALGERAGPRMIRWTRRNHRIGLDNLHHAYPGISREEARQLLRRVYSHFGRAAVETAFAHRMLTPSSFRSHVKVINEHHLNRPRQTGRGAILVTGHFGVWEIFSALLRNLGIPTTSVYRPLKNRYLDGYVRLTRRRFGQTMVPRVGAMPRLLRVLHRGGYIALLVDQHAKRDGIWTPFFGRPASTTPAPALLALRTGAPIIVGFARRLPGRYRFEACFDEPIHAESTGDRDADVYRITLEINRRIESYVRRFPEQWLWLHRRWHRIPDRVDEKGRADVRPSRGPA